MGILADRNLFLLHLKRDPRLVIKTFPIFFAVFPSLHCPRFVSGMIFLSRRVFVFSFYYLGQVSVGSVGETESGSGARDCFGAV